MARAPHPTSRNGSRFLATLILMLLFVSAIVAGASLVGTRGSPITAQVNRTFPNLFLAPDVASFGFNDGLWNGGPSFQDPRYASVLKASGGMLLRYPGGSCSSYWNWTIGGFCEEASNPLCVGKPSQYVNQPGHAYNLDDVIAALPSIGSSAALVLDLNVASDDLANQLAMVQYTISKGATVAAIELGNEIYYGGGAVSARYPTVESYLGNMTEWARTLRQHVPGIPLTVPVWFDGFFGDHNNRTLSWNNAVAEWIAGHGRDPSTGQLIVDGLQVHTYFFNGIDENPTLASPTYLCADTAEKGLLWGTDDEQQVIMNRLSSNDSAFVARMLSVPFDGFANYTQQMAVFDAIRSDPSVDAPPLGVYATEFNMLAWCGPSRMTWAHALYTTSIAMLMLQDGRHHTQLALYHDATGNPLFSALYYFPETLQGMCCGRYKQVTMYTPTAVGLALGEILSPASAGATAACAVDFDPQPTAPGYRNWTGQTYPTLFGTYFENGVGTGNLMVINLSPMPRDVSLWPQGSRPRTGANAPEIVILTGKTPLSFATNGLQTADNEFVLSRDPLSPAGTVQLPPLSVAMVTGLSPSDGDWSCG